MGVCKGAARCIVEDNVISGCRDSISLIGDGGGNHIRRNTCTWNYIKSLDPNSRDHVQTWRRVKSQGFKDGRGIALTDHGDGNQVYENQVFDHWGGVQTVEDWGKDRPARGTKVFRNTITNICDDGLEPTGCEVDSEWFENRVFNAGQGIRMKNCSVGPAYFYRNVIHSSYDPPYRGPDKSSSWAGGRAIYFFVETPGRMYIYHNSFETGDGFVCGTTRAGTDGFPNTWILNNIFSCRNFGRTRKMKWTAQVHYNWCGGDAKEEPWMGVKNIIAPGPRIWDNEDKTFALPAGHPSLGAGLDLSKPFILAGVEHPALPGMADYYKGGRVDMGALQGVVKEARGGAAPAAFERHIVADKLREFGEFVVEREK
ncbi:MAG TPA: right-handed parallel beta-helix repeat-containing protein [Candidatus Brocadiia bacterium]|nr:right-handed parallel beta-helix repeat-containing protein [Candidatus Brocadiia bacterium]